MSPNEDSPQPTDYSINLSCRKCGRTIDSTADELFQFITSAWPDCCNEGMALRIRLRWPENPSAEPAGGR
jgi:hypothetical protein